MLLSEPIVKTCASIDFNPDRIRLTHGLAEDMHTLIPRIFCQWLKEPNFVMIEYSLLLPDTTMVFKVRSYIRQHLSQLRKLGGLVSGPEFDTQSRFAPSNYQN